jgi:hypothetical protein
VARGRYKRAVVVRGYGSGCLGNWGFIFVKMASAKRGFSIGLSTDFGLLGMFRYSGYKPRIQENKSGF